MPLLPFARRAKVRAKKIRLVEIEPDAAIERRPAHVRAGRPRAAEEVHVVVLGVDARLLLRAVADAEVHALVVALRHRHADRHFVGLLLRVQRLDVGELEQLHAVQPPLRVLHDAALIEIAGLERQLAADDVLVDALVADDFHRPEMRELARLRRRTSAPPASPSLAVVFAGRDLARRESHGPCSSLTAISCVADDELAIARLPDLQRQPLLQIVEVRRPG